MPARPPPAECTGSVAGGGARPARPYGSATKPPVCAAICAASIRLIISAVIKNSRICVGSIASSPRRRGRNACSEDRHAPVGAHPPIALPGGERAVRVAFDQTHAVLVLIAI